MLWEMTCFYDCLSFTNVMKRNLDLTWRHKQKGMRLELIGQCKATISDGEIKVEDVETTRWDEDTLVVTGNTPIGNGNQISVNGNSISIGGNVGTVSGGTVCNYFGFGNRPQIVVDGVDVTKLVNNEKAKKRMRDPDNNNPFVYKLKADDKVEEISVHGSSNITITDHSCLYDYEFEVDISGSGSVYLPHDSEFRRLAVNISGCGKLMGEGCKTDIFDGSISGVGRMSGITVKSRGTARVSGVGGMILTQEHGARITKHISGLGSVDVISK